MTRQKAQMRALLFLLALSACQSETAAPPASDDSAAACAVTYVVDGDTLHLDCGSGRIKARLLGFDTPEISDPACRAEAEAGARATEVLRSIVASAPITQARFDGTDRYGRALVALQIGGQDLAAQMIASGLAQPYAGRKRPDWCAILGSNS